MSNLSPNLTVMFKAVEKATRSLARDFSEVEKLQITVKGPGDFVSRADKRSEEIIVESLQQSRPEWGILGEEGTNIKGSDPRYRWIIDPLDGTNNFLHGLPHWCVTIALEKEGEIVAGLTVDPIRNENFRVEKGGGAFMDRTRLRMSGRKELKDALVLVDQGYARRNEADFKMFSDVVPLAEKNTAAVRIQGAGALDLCYVAAGRFDLMFHCGGAKPWDLAAGFLMVREANGIITDHALKPTTFENGQFLAGNPGLHGAFADLIGLKK